MTIGNLYRGLCHLDLILLQDHDRLVQVLEFDLFLRDGRFSFGTLDEKVRLDSSIALWHGDNLLVRAFGTTG